MGGSLKDFVLFKMKKDFYERLGLPEIPFPVPLKEIEQLTITGNIEFPMLLYWLQEYSASCPDKWLHLEDAIIRLAELLAPKDDRDTVPVEGDMWFFQLSTVDLEREIVTIQRQDHLLAAMQPLEDGRLIVSVYRPLDAKACSYLIALGVRPDPTHGVNMRVNNWEYALDNSATMGNMYASERGESYLSYWEHGIGLNSEKKSVPGWIDMRKLHHLPVNISAVQVGVWYMNSHGDS